MKPISNVHQRNVGAKEHHVMKAISNVHQRNVGAKGTPRNEGHL